MNDDEVSESDFRGDSVNVTKRVEGSTNIRSRSLGSRHHDGWGWRRRCQVNDPARLLHHVLKFNHSLSPPHHPDPPSRALGHFFRLPIFTCNRSRIFGKFSVMLLTARLACRANLPSGGFWSYPYQQPSSTHTRPFSGLSVDAAGHSR